MNKILILIAVAATLLYGSCTKNINDSASSELKSDFQNPPDWARPVFTGILWMET